MDFGITEFLDFLNLWLYLGNEKSKFAVLEGREINWVDWFWAKWKVAHCFKAEWNQVDWLFWRAENSKNFYVLESFENLPTVLKHSEITSICCFGGRRNQISLLFWSQVKSCPLFWNQVNLLFWRADKSIKLPVFEPFEKLPTVLKPSEIKLICCFGWQGNQLS